jgi:hypothetical protein
LTQQASGYEIKQGRFIAKDRSAVHNGMIIQKEESIQTGEESEGNSVPEDWRWKIIHCIKKPGEVKDQKVWRYSLKYNVTSRP